MALEAWRSHEKSEGYVSVLMEMPYATPERTITHLKERRPWYGKIQLPIRSDTGRDEGVKHLECHDLDCLLAVIRMLIAGRFIPENKYRRSAIMTCAFHRFGQDEPADYKAREMLISKLFPDYLDNLDILQAKLTFGNLMKHPGIDKVIFGDPSFGLKNNLLLSFNKGLEQSASYRFHPSSFEDMTNESEVKWDGIETLGKTVADQSADIDRVAENEAADGTKIFRRYCNVPQFIRVLFTPTEGHPRCFDDVREFQLVAPVLQPDGAGMLEEAMSDWSYRLAAVVRINPEDPVGDQTEVRVYNAYGRMIRPHRAGIIKADSKWKLGDPKFSFMLFYSRWDPVPPEMLYHVPAHLDPPAEYRSPSPDYIFDNPMLPVWDPKSPSRDEEDEARSDTRTSDSPLDLGLPSNVNATRRNSRARVEDSPSDLGLPSNVNTTRHNNRTTVEDSSSDLGLPSNVSGKRDSQGYREPTRRG
ncbi:hypothetical protein GQX73_g4523 [Xylaria multiplex]|uniref:Uncharacterized protein n=1 Tax=Xylaria multiplex TaxID=323545 RepID=A0A7C8MZ04_9PEZI|nr:hypothetical protein GQX73_g4523 [Xylaria multiplex]